MKHGRFICDTLKSIRLDIARANGIEYVPAKCNHKGECTGACPVCESEMRYLEREIARRRSLGKAALITGVSLAVSSLSAIAGNRASSEALMSSYSTPSQVCDTTVRQEIFGMSPFVMPHFRGGERALLKFLQENVVYPPEAVKDSIQGKVIVQFIVDKSGNVGEVKVVRPVHELLDQEAVRVVKILPKFYPGHENGRPVSVLYTLPVTVKLQDDNPVTDVEIGSPSLQRDTAIDDEVCIEEPDVLPEFPGGLEGLMNYLSSHIKYPKLAAKNKVQGRVVVRFIVDKTGKVTKVEVLESVDFDLAEEAVRVVKSLPNFTPGLVNDEPVNVWFTLPVNFKLPE